MNRRRKIVIVSDKMQRGYRYALTAPMGRNFDLNFAQSSRRRKCSHLAYSAGGT